MEKGSFWQQQECDIQLPVFSCHLKFSANLQIQTTHQKASKLLLLK